MTFAEEQAYIRERLRSRSTELMSGASVARHADESERKP